MNLDKLDMIITAVTSNGLRFIAIPALLIGALAAIWRQDWEAYLWFSCCAGALGIMVNLRRWLDGL